MSAGVVGAGKNFTMDASTSGASYDFHSISGSSRSYNIIGGDGYSVQLLLTHWKCHN